MEALLGRTNELRSDMSIMRKRVATIVLVSLLVNPATGFAATYIPGFYGKVTPPATNTLPQVLTTPTGATVVTDSSTNTLTVNQNQGLSNVVIDWSSFNIGSSATVRFNQGTGTPGTASWKANTSYAVLNRIYDQNPSLIYGKLLADGKVFLINQNGILFGAGSQVNVHTLFASSLAMTLSYFNNNILSFAANPGSTPGAVSNSGTITTDDAGSVFLIAPNVENYGTIDARYGQIGLLAGSEVSLAAAASAASGTSTIWYLVPNVASASAGTAVNRGTGRLNADSGMIGMYGATVEQDGVIRAVTAIKRNGEIQLLARDRIVTGAGSSTSTPITDSTETVAVNTSDTSSTFSTGKISLQGLNTSPTKRIELYGAITAPSGTVALNAEERVYLDSGSSIDVSGVWSDKQAKDATISAQLTSIILRDSYDQKNGVLKGDTVTVSSLSGSSFGSLSDTIATQQMTARDRSTTGGSVTVQVTSGDLIAKEGSVLNISGGGFRYAAGTTSVTKLFSGNTVYDISTAPETITYSGLLGSFTQTSGKFGTVGTWTGLYLGGGTALKDYSQGYTQGSNAGSLTLSAGSLVLNSAIEAGVTRGIYQTLTAEQVDAYGLTKTSGLLEPTAGTLTIGVTHPPGSGLNDTMAISDAVTRQVVVAADTASLSSSFDPETTPVDATKTTVLSSQILNTAGLANLSINANTSITTEKDANIVLAAAGSFSAMARRIEHNGSITVPSGAVTLTAADNLTTYSDNPDKEFDAGYTSKVYLATGSSISVAGEKVDNLAAKLAGNAIAPARTTGGTITVQDATDSDDGITTINGLGLVVNKGAVLDVSGGYAIDTSGKMTGGDAGTLNLQGAAIIANGDFRGFSLPGKKGGTISLAADSVEVMTQIPGVLSQNFGTTTLLPEFTANGTGTPSEYLLIAGNRFDDTGFATISLTSRNDLTVDSGVTIAPSRKKLQVPVSGSSGGSSAVAINNYATANGQAGSDGSVAFNDVGSSSVSLLAGLSLVGDSSTHATNDNASVTVAANSSIKVAPGSGGTITVTGKAVTIAGTLDAPAGTISVTASTHDLTVDSSARISAAGYDMPDATVVATGITAGYNPLNAGTVNLAANGNLVLEERSVVDVSGSEPVTVASANGTAVPTVAQVASSPGTVNISYLGTFSNAGTLKAKRYQDNLAGGTLTVNSKGTGIEVSGDLISGYLASGFDSLKFQSSVAVNLSGSMDLSVGRSLTLDAPMITGSGSDTVKLSAPWIQIANSAAGRGPAAVDDGKGKATLELDSTWLDLTGDVVLDGFAKSYLTATRDIRLADLEYSYPTTRQSGRLATAGDLTLTADRIYTKMTETTINDDSTNKVDEIKSTPTDYLIDVGGKLTTMPSSDPTSGLPVYSAGGSLTITAAGGFEHNGTILVPLGTISIDTGTSRVFLGEGSVLSTAGSTNVAYGYLDANSAMRTDDKTNSTNTSGVVVSEAPQKSITINGDTVIVKQGATIDISGGGSVSAYSFQAGIEGSANPYTANGRMVIVAGNRYDLPGTAVYLNGGSGLAAGVYTILPASYAFLPGAYVIADMGTTKPGGTYQTTTGASVVSGYSTVAGTAISSNRLHYYSVWAASDLRQDGNFTTVSLAGNDAGSLAINANTAVLNGLINVSAPSGSQGGALTFGGTNLTVQTDVTTLAESFGFDSALGADLANSFQVKSDYLTGKGLREITLGTGNTTSITVAKGSTLTAPEINLITSSSDDDSKITIGEGVTIRADKSQVIGTDGSTSYSGGSVTISSGGTVSIGSSAEVYAGGDLNLTAKNLSLGGSLKGNASTLNVSSGAYNLYLGTDSETAGLSLGDRFFSALSGFTSMSLASKKDIRIVTDFSLTVSDTLSIDGARIVADASQPVSATFSAKKFELLNSSNATAGTDSPVGGGVLTFSGDSGTIGNGSIGISGFDTTSFTATNSLAFLGKGSLSLDRGNLDITAAQITAGPAYLATTGDYQAASFAVSSGTGALALIGKGPTPTDSGYLGGSLSFTGSKITSSATIELKAGQVSMTATGNSGVTLESGAKILARGYDYAAASDGTMDHEAGGTVTLRADNGPVTVAGGAVIDVSAPGAGDAGSVTLISPSKGVTVADGTLNGKARSGQGGSFTIDSLSLDGVGGLDGLSALLAVPADDSAAGGFNNLIAIHSYSGDLTLAGNKTLTGREVTVTADNGNLTLDGTIKASGDSGGGRVELNAGHNLTVNGTINASGGTTGKGGDVLLNVAAHAATSDDGTLSFAGTIDVSGSTGGTVAFRAPQTADYTDVKMTLNGTVTGASQVTAEAVKVHHYDGDVNINGALQTTLASDVTYFLAGVDNSGAVNKDATASAANITSVTNRLSGELGSNASTYSTFSLLPGIELQSTGNITLAADWNLSGAAWRVGGVQNGAPGVLTLRAAGDLTINYKLVDRYNTAATSNLSGTTGRPSWGLNLIAGSDLTSSDLLAVKDNKLGTTGKLTIDGNNTEALVYTESGPIRFASFGDTVLGKGYSAQYMNHAVQAYTLASYSGSIRGETGGSLYVKGGAIETATGDITLQVGADLNLYSTGTLGSIRTTGYSPQAYNSWWTYTGGGDINLDVAGDVNGQVDTTAWDLVSFNRASGNKYYWSASFSGTPTAGLATMGGGNLYVRSGGDFDSQAGTFGNVASATGNLTILSGGDLTGRFNVSNGNGVIHAAGNITTTDSGNAVAIGAPGLGNLSVVAQGGVTLGTVYDPKIAISLYAWNPSYTESSRLYVNAVHGDLEMTGTNPPYSTDSNLGWRNAILPASVFLFAGNDILLENSLYLAPSSSGNLQIDAGRDINGSYGANAKAKIVMSDADPNSFYGTTSIGSLSESVLFGLTSHTNTDTQRDSRPISITAVRDLEDIQIGAPKEANLYAGRDIRDIYYVGQNLNSTDFSSVSAGRDITFSSVVGGSITDVTGLEQDGPGAFLVQAGRNIDLGTSAGITTKGNAWNSALDSTKGSDLYVVAGADSAKTPDSVVTFFEGDSDNNIKGLQEYGIEYSELKAAGDTAGAQQRLDEARTLLIDRFFGGQTDTGTGTINMTSSQISTLAGKDNIYIMARGEINVGKTALILDKTLAAKKQANTGIFTAKGGAIDIFSGGDLNVNESRVMSFQGGDLTLWSDHGNVNAGRGSKTAISTSEPTLSKNEDGTYSYVFSPPSVGSGIRTLTYSSKLGESAPEAGDIYVFAPEGNIDAGEAGIAGNKVVLGATEVLNSQNITAGIGSVGVPASSGSSVSIGSLSGSSGLADSSKMIEQTAGVGAARDALKSTTQVLDDFMAKFLDVKVISFDSDPGDDGNVKDKDKDKREK